MNIQDLFNYDGTTTAVISAGLALLLLATLLVTKLRRGRFITPITTLLVFAVVHDLLGYEAGFITANRINQTADALDYVMGKAMFMVALGIGSTLLAYIFTPVEVGNSFGSLLWRGSHNVPLSALKTRSRLLIALSIILLVGGLMGLGGIPLFNPALGKDRYLNTFRPTYNWVGFMANRGRDFIQLPAALLLIAFFRKKAKFADLTLGIVAVFGCLMIVERTPLVDIFLILVATLLLRNKTTFFAVTGVLLCFGYLSTQLLLDSAHGGDLSSSFGVVATALPEIRDFALTLISDPPRYHGLTFLVGVLPVPGFVSEFTTDYLLRTVTLKAAGIPLDAGHGGLRITMFGEAYINFGAAGPIVFGLLLGYMCAAFETVCDVAMRKDDIRFHFVVATLWMFLFEVYLSGSGVAGMVKTMSGLLVALLIAVPQFRSGILHADTWRARRWSLPKSMYPAKSSLELSGATAAVNFPSRTEESANWKS
jgi:oligosaccharide repeat unit polymerase